MKVIFPNGTDLKVVSRLYRITPPVASKEDLTSLMSEHVIGFQQVREGVEGFIPGGRAGINVRVEPPLDREDEYTTVKIHYEGDGHEEALSVEKFLLDRGFQKYLV